MEAGGPLGGYHSHQAVTRMAMAWTRVVIAEVASGGQILDIF